MEYLQDFIKYLYTPVGFIFGYMCIVIYGVLGNFFKTKNK